MEFLSKKILIKIVCSLRAPLAAAFIAFCWQWYHISHRPIYRAALITITTWIVVWALFFLFKKIYKYLTEKFRRHGFWRKEFLSFLDELFLIASLFFVVFLIRVELCSLIFFCSVLILLYVRLDSRLGKHPAGDNWRVVARTLFILSAFIFAVSAGLQYFSYKFYILDSSAKYYNIVLFRSLAITMFWLCGFGIASILYLRLKNRMRHAFWLFWAVLFILALFLGITNAAVLYNLGLYISPVVVEHAGGGGIGVFWRTTVASIGIFILAGVVFVIILKKFLGAHRDDFKHSWYFFDSAVICLAFFSFITIASLFNTPEATIIRSFYAFFKGADTKVELLPVVAEKLKRFGLNYNEQEFYVSQKSKVYENEKQLLPEKFGSEKPNIIIVFLESFSSRLTEVYNPRLSGLTPGLNEMAGDAETTVFHNVYNPSTPTVTGLIAELCSFLPPTGHNEIEQEKHLQSHHLFCLPQALSDAGWKSSLYVTAVDREFANKDSILKSMGVKEFWGTSELSKKISGDPLAWGYSDHQMFPAFFDELKNLNQPFLSMISTVDTHPPFDLVKDEIKYEGGKNRLLNTIHTTDDAFKKFWAQFKESEFATNTIVIAIADHAVFPTAYTKDYFPDETGKMNFYDELVFMMYVPGNILSKEVSVYASAMDFAPTLLHTLKINTPNAFEGYSIFDNRENFPNLLGMHEFGLWINEDVSGQRKTSYAIPADLRCGQSDISSSPNSPLTLCEYYNYFQWKRRMFEEGRLWLAPGKK